MKFRLILDISKTLLLARPGQTIVAAIGVTFGIMTFISLVSFMTGLNKLLDGLILNRTPHILLYNEIKPTKLQPIDLSEQFKNRKNFVSSVKPKDSREEIHNSIAILEYLKNDEHVLGIAPRITARVFYNAGVIDINGTVFGIDVSAEKKLFFFDDYIIKGRSEDLERVPNSIVLGKGVAEKMLVDIGDQVQVTTPKGQRLSLKVVGIFQLGIADIDALQSYASIRTTQKLMGEPRSYLTEIQVKLLDMELAPELGKRYSKLFNTDSRDIKTANTQFETGSSIRNVITYAVSITLLIVAGFGIYNILNMMIYEKMDSIAILKATGFSGKDVRRIFLTLSLIIGVSGGILGLLLGYILSVTIDQIPFHTSSLPAIKTYPINYDILFYFIGFIFSFLTTYFAGFFPARKASKVDPVVIIRGK